jgi:hypothetical protein
VSLDHRFLGILESTLDEPGGVVVLDIAPS